MISEKIKGRGAQSNPKNRFDRLYIDNLIPDLGFSEFLFDEEFSAAEAKVPTDYYIDNSKSVIAKNDSKDLGFNYSFNPYRGCEHGCIYCYARPTHEFLGFSAGIDFETKIMVKEHAAELLAEEFNKKNYKPEVILFSGDTDCYQPLERNLKITRKALQVCLDYRNPVSVITKNALILRDLDILKKLNEFKLVSTCLSVTTLDNSLAGKMEPRASSPEKRLNAVKVLSGNKIPVGVNVSPVIPGLTESEIPGIIKIAAENGASFAGYAILRLPYSVKDLFIEWLNNEFPEKAVKVINRIKELHGGKLNDSHWGIRMRGEGEYAETIKRLFKLSCNKYNLNYREYRLNTNLFMNKSKKQMEIFSGDE